MRGRSFPIPLGDRDDTVDRAVRPLRGALREVRRHVWRAHEGLETSRKALDTIASIATRTLGEGPREAELEDAAA